MASETLPASEKKAFPYANLLNLLRGALPGRLDNFTWKCPHGYRSFEECNDYPCFCTRLYGAIVYYWQLQEAKRTNSRRTFQRSGRQQESLPDPSQFPEETQEKYIADTGLALTILDKHGAQFRKK